jgi:hypothetical protein
LDKSNQSIEEFIAQGRAGRHETFTPRYGWLTKGFMEAGLDPKVFTALDAIERLGVGKNMVRSIRFWCTALGLLEEDMSPTFLGKELLAGKYGWDPYLEDDASLWLLHWQLFIPPFRAVSWPLVFNYCNLPSFDAKDLLNIIKKTVRPYPNLSGLSDKTFMNDASCLMRMYTDRGRESEIDCPFDQLGLIYTTEERNRASFNYNAKPSLPALIFAAACFSYIHEYYSQKQKSISLEHLTFGFNSPGVAFKISETQAGSYLEEASALLGGFSLANRLGEMQLFLSKEPINLHGDALKMYYAG